MPKSHSQIEQSEPVAITYTFRPHFDGTLVTVGLITGTGDRCHRDVLWRGRLSIGRDDLAGLTPRRVAILLSDRLHETWADEMREMARAQSEAGVHLSLAKPPEPQEGATGAAVQQDTLPGL